MRCLRIVCAVTGLLAGTIATAAAAEPAGSIPRATLSAMGFDGVQAIADGEGLAVRGKGSYAIVWGTGYGVIVRQHFARGSGPGTSTGPGGFSGGSSKAFAR